VKTYLLDVNLLLALAWPNHVHHGESLAWFQEKAANAFRTCPLTQTGFVRISANPAFTTNPVLPSQALALLEQITALPGHQFWPDDLPASEAFSRAPLIATHRQITDAYLLALAAAHDGVLATLDRGVARIARHWPNALEIVGD
jgi:toxin-antitoxin system PIN domain toxin